ncbi:MAG: hypothetical protein HY317_04670 [Acidobacteria bacterium]|nr:hypothetical protein [Acidobacteriota bacterium]
MPVASPRRWTRKEIDVTEPTPPVYLRMRGKIDQATERLALRATLIASRIRVIDIAELQREGKKPEEMRTILAVPLTLAHVVVDALRKAG